MNILKKFNNITQVKNACLIKSSQLIQLPNFNIFQKYQKEITNNINICTTKNKYLFKNNNFDSYQISKGISLKTHFNFSQQNKINQLSKAQKQQYLNQLITNHQSGIVSFQQLYFQQVQNMSLLNICNVFKKIIHHYKGQNKSKAIFKKKLINDLLLRLQNPEFKNSSLIEIKDIISFLSKYNIKSLNQSVIQFNLLEVYYKLNSLNYNYKRKSWFLDNLKILNLQDVFEKKYTKQKKVLIKKIIKEFQFNSSLNNQAIQQQLSTLSLSQLLKSQIAINSPLNVQVYIIHRLNQQNLLRKQLILKFCNLSTQDKQNYKLNQYFSLIFSIVTMNNEFIQKYQHQINQIIQQFPKQGFQQVTTYNITNFTQTYQKNQYFKSLLLREKKIKEKNKDENQPLLMNLIYKGYIINIKKANQTLVDLYLRFQSIQIMKEAFLNQELQKILNLTIKKLIFILAYAYKTQVMSAQQSEKLAEILGYILSLNCLLLKQTKNVQKVFIQTYNYILRSQLSSFTFRNVSKLLKNFSSYIFRGNQNSKKQNSLPNYYQQWKSLGFYNQIQNLIIKKLQNTYNIQKSEFQFFLSGCQMIKLCDRQLCQKIKQIKKKINKSEQEGQSIPQNQCVLKYRKQKYCCKLYLLNK